MDVPSGLANIPSYHDLDKWMRIHGQVIWICVFPEEKQVTHDTTSKSNHATFNQWVHMYSPF